MNLRGTLLVGLTLLVLLVVLGVGSLVSLTATQTGSELIVRALLRLVPGEVTFQTIRGRLIDRMTLGGLVYRSDTLSVRVRQLEIGWDPVSLTSWTLRLDRIRLDDIRVYLSPSSPSKDPWSPPGLYLPLSVEVGNLKATDLQYFAPGSTSPDLRLDRVSVRGELGPLTTRVEQFEVHGPRLFLDLQGWVQPRGSYRMDLRVNWGWTSPEATAYRGSGRLTGSLEEISLQQTLTEPFSLEVTGRVTDPLTDLRWSVRTRLSNFNLGRVREAFPDAIVTGPVRGSGTLTEVRVRADLAGSFRGWEDLNLHLDAAYEAGTVHVQLARLSKAGTPMTVTAGGTVTPDPLSVDLRGNWKHLQWPVSGTARLRSRIGSYQVRGDLEEYELEVSGPLDLGPDELTLQLEAQLAGRGRDVRIEQARAQVLEGILTAEGRATLTETPSWELDLSARGINPAGRFPEWPGTLDFSGRVEGQYTEKLQLDLKIPMISGQLRNQPFQGELTASIRGDLYRVQRFRLESREARIQLAGQIDEHLDGSWSIRIPRVSSWWKQMEGTLSSEGEIGGTLTAPVLSGTLDGESLSWGPFGVETVSASFSLDRRANRSSWVRVTGRALQFQGRWIERAEIRASGEPGDLTLQGDVQASWGSSQFRLAGGWVEGTWRGRLEDLTLNQRKLGEWNLAEPSAIIVSPDRYTLAHSCLTAQKARLCGSFSGSPSQFDGSVSLDYLPLTRLDPWIAETIQVTGILGGRIRAHYEPEPGWTGNGEFTVGAGEVTLTTQFESPTRIEFSSLSVESQLEPQRLTAKGSVQFPGQGTLQADFKLANPLSPSTYREKPLSLQLQGELNSLQVMDLVSDDLQWRGGRARARLQVNGTVNRPKFGGQFSLGDAQVRIYPLGITLSNVSIEGRSTDRGELMLDGSAVSGGQLNVSGRIRPDTGGPWSFVVTASGTNFTLLDLPEARVVVNPDLTLRGNPPNLSLRGHLGIPRARITQGLVGRTEAVEVSRDVVIVSDRPEPAKKPGLASLKYWRLTSEVTVSLGSNISINLANFSGSLTGDLVVREEPGQPTTGEGTLTITQGIYRAYGQTLKIDDGQVIFARTPITNPRISLSAVRRIRDQDVLVGVRVRGTLQNPELTLFSEPTLSQTDILSYLVLGRPASDATSSSAQLLMRAASSIGLQSGDMLVSRIADQFGLSGVSLESKEGFQGSSLVLGRYLSPRLYVSYGLGIFESSNVLQFRYRLNEHWSIQGEGGDQTSADLIYSIQR